MVWEGCYKLALLELKHCMLSLLHGLGQVSIWLLFPTSLCSLYVLSSLLVLPVCSLQPPGAACLLSPASWCCLYALSSLLLLPVCSLQPPGPACMFSPASWSCLSALFSLLVLPVCSLQPHSTASMDKPSLMASKGHHQV